MSPLILFLASILGADIESTLEGFRNTVTEIISSPGNSLVICLSEGEGVRAFKIPTNRPEYFTALDFHPVAIAVDSQHKVCVVVGTDIASVDIRSGKVLKRARIKCEQLSVTISHEGKMAVTAGSDKVIRRYSVETLAFKDETRVEEQVSSLAARGNIVVAGGAKGGVTVFNEAMEQKQKMKVASTVSTMGFAETGYLVVGDWDGVVSVFDINQAKLVARRQVHDEGIIKVQVMPNGKQAASLASDRSLCFFSLPDLKVITRKHFDFQPHAFEVSLQDWAFIGIRDSQTNRNLVRRVSIR